MKAVQFADHGDRWERLDRDAAPDRDARGDLPDADELRERARTSPPSGGNLLATRLWGDPRERLADRLDDDDAEGEDADADADADADEKESAANASPLADELDDLDDRLDPVAVTDGGAPDATDDDDDDLS